MKYKICKTCGKKFPKKPWPTTRQFYCSPNCSKKAWKFNHPEYDWQKKSPEKARKIKRKWNWSEKGKEYRRQWYKKNKERINKKPITRKQRKMILSRQQARRIMLKISKPKCIICNKTYRTEVHHIDFNPFNNNINNLEWRCKLHHTDIHHTHNLHLLKGIL